MRHFTTEDWIDFVNNAASRGKQVAMQEHLDTGCESCAKAAALWQRVRRAAVAEARYQPPADTVRVVLAAFGGSALAREQERSPGLIEVVFDSFAQPLLAGARSAGRATRQMVYRADPYQIDLQIEARPETNRLAVTGQLLDMSQPEVVGHAVPVVLSNRHGHVVRTVTNQYGEFRGEIDNNGELELSFQGPGDKSIVISLRDPLGQALGGAR